MSICFLCHSDLPREGEGDMISHGLCRRCARRWVAELRLAEQQRAARPAATRAMAAPAAVALR